MLVVVASGTWLYAHLSGNITALPLFSGAFGNAGTETPDAFGNLPINLLVIGSDARANADDCRLGGGCGHRTSDGAGANADVEILVHLAADRSNATVMSIPRDTVTDIPSCVDAATGRVSPAYHGMINSALAHGPGCQVAAVHALTGIPIDHFMMVDFAGVVTMADAIGGVSVCVSDNVYDTYSHLKLRQGTHVLAGQAALEFVRSRHAFGDGSDIGRTFAQHLYLASLERTLKSGRTLADPTKVYALADAATRALTVDTGLDSITRLVGLAADLDRIPADRTTFTTMQTAADPGDRNRVVVGPNAQQLFDAIAHDVPVTPARGGPTPDPAVSTFAASTTPTPSLGAASVSVRVLNGSGIAGRAAAVASALAQQGFLHVTRATDTQLVAQTEITYVPGRLSEAQSVAAAVGLPPGRLRMSAHLTDGTPVLLTIGRDWPAGVSLLAAAEPAPKALDGAHAETADQSRSCAPVSRQPTVTIAHLITNPVRAYDIATSEGIPDSAA